jgi:hypothetical protein
MVTRRWLNADQQATLARTWHTQGTELAAAIDMTIGQNYRCATLSKPKIKMPSI